VPSSTTCLRCGAPIQFESGAEVVKCGACGAVRPAADELPTAEVVAEPPEAETGSARPARRAPTPRTDEALAAFASGCYWARVGLSLEALGYALALVLFGLASIARDEPAPARGAPPLALLPLALLPLALLPLACTAVGALFTAWGRSSVLALGAAGGAERVLGFAAVLACLRAVLVWFAVVAVALAVFGGREYELSLARGGLAAVGGGILALLAEVTALAGLAAAAAARGLVQVRDRALAAVLALQILGSAALVIAFVLGARGASSKGGFEVGAYGLLAACYLWYVYAQFALYTAGAAVLEATVGRARR